MTWLTAATSWFMASLIMTPMVGYALWVVEEPTDLSSASPVPSGAERLPDQERDARLVA